MKGNLRFEDINDIDFIIDPEIDPPDEYNDVEMCDWCGVRPVTYRNAAYHLCEICEEQLWGD